MSYGKARQQMSNTLKSLEVSSTVVGYLDPAGTSSLVSLLYPRQIRNTPKHAIFRSRSHSICKGK